MRKMSIFALLACALLGVVAAPALAAVPTEDLTLLSRYFPAETPLYIATRIDPDFVGEIDDLIGAVVAALPAGTVPPVSLTQLLEQQIIEQYGAGYDETFGGWLGGVAAFGALSLETTFDDDFSSDSETPFLAVLSITDRAGAIAFVEALNESESLGLEASVKGDFDVYAIEDEPGAIAINDEVMLIAMRVEDMNLGGDFLALDDTDAFNDAAALLPEDEYNALVYVNMGDTYSAMFDMMSMDSMGTMMMDEALAELIDEFAGLYEEIPAIAVGFTILDGRSLTMDIAQLPYDYTAAEELFDVEISVDPTPVDLAFAANIPADAPLVLMDANVGADIDIALDVLASAASIGLEIAAEQDEDARQYLPVIRRFDGPALREYFDLTFRVVTGLDMNEDVLPLLDGAFASYVRIYPNELTTVMADAVVLVEVTDERAVAGVVDELTDTLEDYEVDYERSGNVLTIPGVIRGLFPAEFPREMLDTPELDFQVGYNDSVVAIGSRSGVADSLDITDSLADDPAFIAAQEYFLPETTALAYVSFDPIADLIGEAIPFAEDMGASESEVKQIREAQAALDALLSSAAITSFITGDGSVVSRASITLEAQ